MSMETGGSEHLEPVVADIVSVPGLRLIQGGAMQESGTEGANSLVPDFGVDEETARTLQLSPWLAYIALQSVNGTQLADLGAKRIKRMLTNREPIVGVGRTTVEFQFVVADDSEESHELLRRVGERAAQILGYPASSVLMSEIMNIGELKEPEEPVEIVIRPSRDHLSIVRQTDH